MQNLDGAAADLNRGGGLADCQLDAQLGDDACGNVGFLGCRFESGCSDRYLVPARLKQRYAIVTDPVGRYSLDLVIRVVGDCHLGTRQNGARRIRHGADNVAGDV